MVYWIIFRPFCMLLSLFQACQPRPHLFVSPASLQACGPDHHQTRSAAASLNAVRAKMAPAPASAS